MVKSKWLWLVIAAMPIVTIGFYFQSTKWHPVSRELATRLLRSNGSGLLQVKDFTKLEAQIQALEVKPNNAPPLTIYAFNSDRLCGIGGCLYSVYRQDTKQLLFKLLLNSTDSQSPPVFDRQQNCLTVKQPTNRRLAQINYCYIGDRYVQNPITYSALSH